MSDLRTLLEPLRERHTIERELGRGGMATVFLARDLKHHGPSPSRLFIPICPTSSGPSGSDVRSNSLPV